MYSTGNTELRNSLSVVRTAALAFALGCAAVSVLPSSVNAQSAEATADGGGSGEATGSNSSSADFGGEGSVDANGGSDPSATGEASTGANAQSNETSSAETQTDSTANAQGTDGVYSANAEANATAGVDQSIATSITAVAEALAGDTPQAAASTTEDGVQTTSAQVVNGLSATANCAGACTQSYEKVSKKKSIAFAVLDNAISLAMTTKKSAYAKSGVYSDLSKKEQRFYGHYFGTAHAAAEAYADRKGARANAQASAGSMKFGGSDTFMSSSRGGKSGYARANSFARATACVGDCKKDKAPPAAAAPVFTLVRDCDREHRKFGKVHFPNCEYKILFR